MLKIGYLWIVVQRMFVEAYGMYKEHFLICIFMNALIFRLTCFTKMQCGIASALWILRLCASFGFVDPSALGN